MKKGRKKTPGAPYIKTEKGFPYYYVTYAPGKRKTLHRMVWEQANGPVPENHVIRFRDQDTLNCALENLELIHRREITGRIRNSERQSEGMRRMYQTPEGKALSARKAERLRQHFQDGTFPLEQRSAKISEMIRTGKMRNPFVELDDNVVAYQLFPHKPEMAAFVLANHPELIAVKRQQTLLKRALKQHENAD
ncbi:HNH endonuclease [Larkinella terrae]|uniref:HNH nuclease domain-containing protein n=1 Tax=Larkinella terrae TaxID=2025311 RepID=A0A7K0EIS1_9BACT|nr:HNH endonuclease [Larkinella terrae]MRS61750.1 hypothetical protein [Larkinella terrae]